MAHEVFSIVAPLDMSVGPADRLTRDADRARSLPDSSELTAWLEQLPMVHFASLQVFAGEARRPEESFQPCLVFESCIDGTIADYLDTLVAMGEGRLLDIFARCRDFQPGGSDRRQYLRSYLQAHVLSPQLYHIGNPNLRVDQIKAGSVLRQTLDGELDAVVSRGRSLDPPRDIVEELRQRMHTPPSTKRHWHLDVNQVESVPGAWFADPVPVVAARLKNWSKLLLLVGVPVALLTWVTIASGFRALAGVLAAAAAVLWLLQTWLRGRNHDPVTVDGEAVRALKALEDFGVQNHMASLILLKDGWARTIAIRVVLRALNVLYRTWYTDITPGKLQGLPTIHFAHWTIVPVIDGAGKRREALLFLSHYDGSWETYLDDFLDHVFSGVVAIWANAVGFPWPCDGPTFKRWARRSMSPWQGWYQAYPALTVLNIQNTDRIRTGLLQQPATDAEARLWLARFGSIKEGTESIEPPLGAVDTQDVQGIVFSGYRHLPHAAYVFLKVEQAHAARRWLVNLVPRITDGRARHKEELSRQKLAYNIAFTSSGLSRLDLPGAALTAFSESFQEGMAPPHNSHRSRALGDIDANHPDHWNWGAGDNRPDILLMIFADDPVTLAAEVRAQVCAFTSRQAGTKVEEIAGDILAAGGKGADAKRVREHFGFIDGISQPEIEGAQLSRRRLADDAADLQKPGEFLLGYPANDGTVTAGVPLQAEFDVQRLLPKMPDDPACRDFGRNGTYLVFRQLAQDVAAFRHATAKAAGSVDWANGPGAAEQAAARMIGRWRDGAPLLPLSTHASLASTTATADDNQFGFTRDRHGFGCPIGSHIRRANPRDSLLPDAGIALNSVNRHRLLRRGRPYGPPLADDRTKDDGHKRGMSFICLNSDIERQFEFVQQNWINSPVFGGLYAERDPVVGTVPADGGSLTVQANGVRERLNGFGQFVTVKGGDYFFLPGISALRYLSSLDGTLRLPAGQLAPRALVAAPPPRFPTALRRTLARFEAPLVTLRLIWSARFPLMLATALVGLALVPRLAPAATVSLFVMGWPGVGLVALLASLTAFAAMITLRLVLMYGWRSTPGRARWVTPAKWPQVLAFQALALPVVLTSMHYSALDLATAYPDRGGYWIRAAGLLPAAAAGMAAALGLLAAVTAFQALRPDSGAGLFFPSTSLLSGMGRSGWRPRLLWRLSGRLSQLSQWIVDSVPAEMGRGYIDYRRRRILPGHAFAATLAMAALVLYILGAVALSPARCAPQDWLPQRASSLLCTVSAHVPVVAYLLFLLAAGVWLLAGLAFFLDRYRVGSVLVLGIWLVLVAGLAQTDHFFAVGDVVKPLPLPPQEVVRAARDRQRPSRIIVVAAEGLGLTSSAWTAQVLAELARVDGFASSLRLVSASSGAALGSAYFVDAFHPSGAGAAAPIVEPAALDAVKIRARAPSSSQAAWGLIYPDFTRTFLPWLVNPLRDRGWAMEQAWTHQVSGTAPTLASWRRGVAEGWRPAIAFGVTLVETGERGLLATYDPPQDLPQVTNGRDLSVFTAARLSATFPYITPVARAYEDRTGYHVADGGYWDNSGVVSTLEWLEAAAPEIGDVPVMLVEIVSSRERHPDPEDRAWTLDLFGPPRTLIEARSNTQPARNALELKMFADRWQGRSGQPLQQVRFALDDRDAALSWNLGDADVQRIAAAWHREDIQRQAGLVKQFLGH